MSEQEGTPFETKCEILADIWLNERDNEDFKDFINYNDLGLPRAYCIANDIVVETDKARSFIEEAFDLLLAGLSLEDEGFEDFDDMMVSVMDPEVFEDEDDDV